MTRKQKPATASKKHAPIERKSVKAAPHKKLPPLREKAHAKAASAKKADTHHAAPVTRAKSVEVKIDGKSAAAKSPAKAPAEKKMLGIERRVPNMPEERQSQLKLLIARGKDQGYLTYSQVNDHLPSEIVDPEQIEGSPPAAACGSS